MFSAPLFSCASLCYTREADFWEISGGKYCLTGSLKRCYIAKCKNRERRGDQIIVRNGQSHRTYKKNPLPFMAEARCSTR